MSCSRRNRQSTIVITHFGWLKNSVTGRFISTTTTERKLVGRQTLLSSRRVLFVDASDIRSRQFRDRHGLKGVVASATFSPDSRVGSRFVAGLLYPSPYGRSRFRLRAALRHLRRRSTHSPEVWRRNLQRERRRDFLFRDGSALSQAEWAVDRAFLERHQRGRPEARPPTMTANIVFRANTRDGRRARTISHALITRQIFRRQAPV